MMDTERRRAVTCEEVDVHGRFRRYIVWRRGEIARVKRCTNQRERRERRRDAERRVREEWTGRPW